MTRDEIIAETETFLEWDTDSRDAITFTSAIFFVEHCLAIQARQIKQENDLANKQM